jgi:hypothetical protein
MVIDNGLKLNQWGSPVLREGKSLVVNDLGDKSAEQLTKLNRLGGNIVAGNSKGLQAKVNLEERLRLASEQKKQEAKQLVASSAVPQAAPRMENGECSPSNPQGLTDSQIKAEVLAQINRPMSAVDRALATSAEKPAIPKTSWTEDLKIGALHASNTIDKAISLPAGGLASLFSTNEGDKVFREMDERVTARNAAMGLEGKEQGFGGKVISAIPQIPTVLFSGADTGTSLIQNGEKLWVAVTGTLVDTTGNAAGLLMPASVGRNFFAKVSTGAAINAGQDLAVRTTISGISDSQASKDQFGPTLETTVLATAPGIALGTASKIKTEISAAGRKAQNSPSIDGETSSGKPLEKVTSKETFNEDVNGNMASAHVEANQKSEEGVSTASAEKALIPPRTSGGTANAATGPKLANEFLIASGADIEIDAARTSNALQGQPRVASTGARQVLNPDSIKAWDAADGVYGAIRADSKDVGAISKNTGLPAPRIAAIKEHVFFKEHQLDSGMRRFDADPDIANSWDRLRKGDFVKSDIDLLQHERFELKFESIFKTDYRTAHDAAIRSGRTWKPE